MSSHIDIDAKNLTMDAFISILDGINSKESLRDFLRSMAVYACSTGNSSLMNSCNQLQEKFDTYIFDDGLIVVTSPHNSLSDSLANEMPNNEQKGCVVNYFQGATINNLVINGDMNKNGIENYYASSPEETVNNVEEMPTSDQLAKAVMAVQKQFWGNSSYAVLFCVCRDYYGYPNNMSMFENEFAELFNDDRLAYKCPTGTIVSAFHNNNYLKLPIEKWKENGAKQRALILAEQFKKALMETGPQE